MIPYKVGGMHYIIQITDQNYKTKRDLTTLKRLLASFSHHGNWHLKSLAFYTVSDSLDYV